MTSSTADAGGSARFTTLTAGRYRVTASLEGRAASQEIDVDGPADLELRLPENSPLRLRVVDGTSGLPLAMISVRVISARGETTVRSGIIGTDGIFELPSFAAQPLTIVIFTRGYAIKTLRGLRSADEPWTIAMAPGGRSFSLLIANDLRPCSFEVRDESGNPIALSLDWNPGPVPLFVRSAVFYAMEPGTYTTALYDCNGKSFSQQMCLAPLLTPELQFP